MFVRVCPLNNIYKYIIVLICKFVKYFFQKKEKKYKCDNLALDKIENKVYNVHRNPSGGLYAYTLDILTGYPLGYS